MSIRQDSELSNIFIDKNTDSIKKMNDIVVMTKLADTLEIIADSNSDAEFYNGKLTELIVKEINEKGGIVKSEDFHNYKIKLETDRFVVRLDDNNRIYSFSSPSSGLLIPFIMKVLKKRGLGKLNKMSETELTTFYQRLTEALKVAFKLKFFFFIFLIKLFYKNSQSMHTQNVVFLVMRNLLT